MQLCINYIVSKNLPVDMKLLIGLDPAHAHQLLTSMQNKTSQVTSKLEANNNQFAKVVTHLGTGRMHAYNCSMCNTKWITTKGLHCVCTNISGRSHDTMLLRLNSRDSFERHACQCGKPCGM